MKVQARIIEQRTFVNSGLYFERIKVRVAICHSRGFLQNRLRNETGEEKRPLLRTLSLRGLE